MDKPKAPAVIVVPVTRDGQIVTIQHPRSLIDDWGIEVPIGRTNDIENDSLVDLVRRKLREEVDATCGAVIPVGFFYSAPSATDEKCYVFLAENVDVNRSADFEESKEITRIKLVPADEVVELDRAGQMKNGACALAVLWCEPLLRERGYI